jgi:hypothetical protein
LLAKNDTEHTLLYYASLLGIIQILERILNWGEEQLPIEELNNINRQTACLLVAAKRKLEALVKRWECANEKLTPQESCNKFSITKNDKERTAWHVTAKMGNVSLVKSCGGGLKRDKPQTS